MTSAISIEHVSHLYPARRHSSARQALKNVSFSVEKGELFGLLGPNGGGKSTLFHILSTVFRPTSGRVSIFGLDAATRAEAVRRKIGVVFQSPALDPMLTVEENLRHHGHLFGLSGSVLSRRLEELAERFAVAERLKDRVSVLSGGLKRRVELAKGLLPCPELLLLDEPSSGLDPIARRSLRETLEDLCEQDGLTVLLTTHFMEEADACHRLAILDQGHLVGLGEPRVLKTQVPRDVIQKRIAASSLQEATLEDVFVQKTGHPFE